MKKGNIIHISYEDLFKITSQHGKSLQQKIRQFLEKGTLPIHGRLFSHFNFRMLRKGSGYM